MADTGRFERINTANGNWRYIAPNYQDVGYQDFFSNLDWSNARPSGNGYVTGGEDISATFTPSTGDVTTNTQEGGSTSIFGIDVPGWLPTALIAGGGALMAGGLLSGAGLIGGTAEGAAAAGATEGAGLSTVGMTADAAGTIGGTGATYAGMSPEAAAYFNFLTGGGGEAAATGGLATTAGLGGAGLTASQIAGLQTGADAIASDVMGGSSGAGLWGIPFTGRDLVTAGGALIGGVGSYLGGQANADAIKNAQDSLAASNLASTNYNKYMFDKTLELNKPFYEAGLSVLPASVDATKAGYAEATAASNARAGLIPGQSAAIQAGLNKVPTLVNEAFTTKDGLSPAAQWQMEQAQRQNADALSARGLTGSGADLELNRRTVQSITGQDYQDSWQRKLDAEKLALGTNIGGAGSTAATGTGTNATNTMSNAASSTGSNVSNMTNQSGIAQANLAAQGGLATGNMYSNLGMAGLGLASSYLKNQGYSGYAEGGRPEPGQPAIVGEEGPEVFVPDQPGTVIPNPQTQARMAEGNKPGAGLRGMRNKIGRDEPEKQEWLKLEAIQNQEIKAAIMQLDKHIMTEGASLEYLNKRDKLQKMLASQIQRVEKVKQQKEASLSGGE